MKEYLVSAKEVMENNHTSEQGLSAQEAASRLEKYGKNKLAEGKKDSLLKRFLSQLADPMIIILIVAAAISAVTAAMSGDKGGYADVIIIMVVVIINAVLGVYQESKAEKAIEALQEIAAATSKVIRDGKLVDVRSEDLVLGDIVVLEAGDSVPADCRIIENASLKIEEAALTGESVPVNKTVDIISTEGSDDVPLGDRKNMCYMGSNVVYGRGKAVVVATGMDTEMGKIADALTQAKDEETPLQIKLNQLSKILSFIVIGISVFIFGFSIVRSLIAGEPITINTGLEFFMVAVSLAVAAIPEGLAAVVTIVLSIGVTKMSKRNAVIRKLTAVETLGCTQIICSDKTGTLTQNKMTVVEYKGSDEKLLAMAMALCCDAELQEDGTVKGEPTEAALVAYADKLELKKYDLEASFPRVGEAPFDSMRKMMSTIHKTENGFVQYTKGAPDVVLSKCTTAYVDGKCVPMTDEIRAEIAAQNKEMADKALRVLCAAMRKHKEQPSNDAEELEQELCYVGLTGMIDPVRPEVVDAIKECASAGIRPIMITGDHKDTAVAIAKSLGIITDESQAITGADLNKISDEELDKRIEEFSVYARVQPEHKVRIVKAWKKKGKITAMTGDGVNDAPSIKNADIGVGMGITGTDVTKNVADMVLADDNFATIVSAVEEGRRIYDNIRASIQFLLSSNLSEVLSIFIATILGFTLFEPVHLLWINLITDCFPALALGMEKGEKNIMSRAPRDSKDGIFAGGMGIDCAWQGVMVTVLTLAAYVAGIVMGAKAEGQQINSFMGIFAINEGIIHQNGMTMAFLTLSMSEIFHSFNMRSRRHSIVGMGSMNWYLIGAMVLSLFLSTVVIYIPFLAKAFDFAHISLAEYATSLGIAFLVIPIVEIVKVFQRAADRKKK